MGNNLKSACDEILQKVVTGKDRVPGVVAMITNRSANVYEGAAGERILGAGQAMTADTVFAIFSTTKAITGTAVLQCVEEGKLDLDAPAAPFLTIEMQKGDSHLEFFTTLTTLGTPYDITLHELRIESFFPADEATDTALRRLNASGVT